MIDDLGRNEMTVNQFLDELRDIKGYTSITCAFDDAYLEEHDKTFFYDGQILEYQVGTKRLVKAFVNVNDFTIKKGGKEYKGKEARDQFKNDKEFKKWKKFADGVNDALIKDACAHIEIYHLTVVCTWKELALPKDYEFCSVRELWSFVLSRDFESVQARYLPFKPE